MMMLTIGTIAAKEIPETWEMPWRKAVNGSTPLLPSRQIAIPTAVITSPRKHARMRRRSELSESVHWSGAVRFLRFMSHRRR